MVFNVWMIVLFEMCIVTELWTGNRPCNVGAVIGVEVLWVISRNGVQTQW